MPTLCLSIIGQPFQFLLFFLETPANVSPPASSGSLTYPASHLRTLLKAFLKSAIFNHFINKKNGVSNKDFNDVQYLHSPYLSIFRLLAYHKICNDHYIYRQWQPYQASLCNVDYLTPNSSSLLNIDDALLAIPGTTKADSMNILDMRFSNLPLDYFTGVLPTAQFGEESVVSLKNTSDSSTTTDRDKWFVDGGTSMPSNAAVSTFDGHNLKVSNSQVHHTHSIGPGTITSEMSLVALRNAVALQR